MLCWQVCVLRRLFALLGDQVEWNGAVEGWRMVHTNDRHDVLCDGTVENKRGCGREEDGGWMMVGGEEKNPKNSDLFI